MEEKKEKGIKEWMVGWLNKLPGENLTFLMFSLTARLKIGSILATEFSESSLFSNTTFQILIEWLLHVIKYLSKGKLELRKRNYQEIIVFVLQFCYVFVPSNEEYPS